VPPVRRHPWWSPSSTGWRAASRSSRS
jgi:hypothetical protein